MMIDCRITIKGEIHQIRVEVTADQTEPDTEALRAFVAATAYMEHFGYLPRGVINAADSPLTSGAAPTARAVRGHS
jgi:hypothetical protein